MVAVLLPSGYPDLPTVARRADIPLRTLQRRLADEGLTFSSLVSEVRFKRACELLVDRSRRIHEIATELGYSDPANFTRAFKTRAGITPTEYRKSMTGILPS